MTGALHQQLVRSLHEEGVRPEAVRFDPNARAYEAFVLGQPGDKFPRTLLLEPLQATALKDALAETTGRWSWHRGQRLGIREIGPRVDQMHVYAVRQKAQGGRVWRGHIPVTEYQHWLDHICTIDQRVVAGDPCGAVGSEVMLHERRQAQRPKGAQA